MSGIEWEPTGEGVTIFVGGSQQALRMNEVRELRDDMEEANLLSRGFEKHELMVSEIKPEDLIILVGYTMTVTNTLRESNYGEEEAWIVQFDPESFSAVPHEIMLPGDFQITVYRRVA